MQETSIYFISVVPKINAKKTKRKWLSTVIMNPQIFLILKYNLSKELMLFDIFCCRASDHQTAELVLHIICQTWKFCYYSD